VTALRTRARRLTDADRPALQRLLRADPVGHCVLIARLDTAGTLAPRQLGGAVWGSDGPAGLGAACFVGGNVVPVGVDSEAAGSVAAELLAAERSCSSIVGTSAAVETLWSWLCEDWRPVRSYRPVQPLLATDRVPDLRADSAVRVVRRGEIDQYLPAAEAMFAEEVGVNPSRGSQQKSYRQHLERMIGAGRALARFDATGRVLFKAEVAAVTSRCTQIQGVWVDPAWRGRGLGTAAMVAVLRRALRFAPVASLYVNDYNVAARRLYARLGMTEVGMMSTVLF
jgi:uncharacterized protein